MLNLMLKRFSWLGLVSLALLGSLIFHAPAIAKGVPNDALPPRHYDQLSFPPLPELQLPDYERYQLANGMVVYLIEDHQLPLVRGNALFRAGSRWEPSQKVGLASLTGTTLRLGGSQAHPADTLNQLLEQRAAAIESSISTSSGSASFDTLAKDTDRVMQLFAEVIQTPAFAPEKIDLAKNQLRGAIARRNDNPGDIASREFGKALYGASSPYARTVEYRNLDAIQREDILSFHQTYIRPDSTILGIVGDFDRQVMKERINKYFGSWQVTTAKPQLEPPQASQKYQAETFLVDQPHLSQSNILLGQMGGKASDPDYPALTVMNGVISGFGGRLFNNIRSKQGLAYSVYGSWQAAYDYPGQFVAGGQTRTDATAPFAQSLLAEIERLRTSSVSGQELNYAKESILNSFVFKFEDPGQTLSRLMTYDYYNYPKNFIFTYQRQVKLTTIADVKRVAQQYLNPGEMILLIVGDRQAMGEGLDSLKQPINPVDITIPAAK